jgi:serine/threonine protein phosphatase PrpC
MTCGEDAAVSRFALVGESIRGASHIRSRKPNQDSFKTALESNALVLAVADGHGSDSCPYSKSGSTIAVNVFCKTMAEYCRRFSDDWDAFRALLSCEGDTVIARSIDVGWKLGVEKAHTRRVAKTAAAINGSGSKEDGGSVWRLFGSTLLGLVIAPGFAFAYQLGDGDIVFASGDGAELVIHGDKLLGTETHSLCNAESWKRAKTEVLALPNTDASCAFMLFSDGFSNSYRNEMVFLQTALDYYKTLEEHGVDVVRSNIKAWLNETSEQGSGDDITVLMAYRGGGG